MDSRGKTVTDDIPIECIQDPQFTKVLAASLCSEIVALDVVLTELDGKIKELKDDISKQLEQRRVIKKQIQESQKFKDVATARIESIVKNTRELSLRVEMAKNRLDDGSLREKAERAKYQNILDEYAETWKRYKINYESRSLAVKRSEYKIGLRKLEIRRSIAEYKKGEFAKMLVQRQNIYKVRTKASIVEASEMVLRRWKDERRLEDSKTTETALKNELEKRHSELTKAKRDQEKQRIEEAESSMMPPPRLDFSFVRAIYTEETQGTRGESERRRRPIQTKSRASDSTSINSLILEEACKNVREKPMEISDTSAEEEGNNENSTNSLIQGFDSVYSTTSKQAKETGFASIIMNRCDNIENFRNLRTENDAIFGNNEPQRENQVQQHKRTCYSTKNDGRKQKNKNSRGNDGNKGDNNEKNVELDAEEENEDEGENYRCENEIILPISHERTQRWCEESRKKIAPFLLSRDLSASKRSAAGLSEARFESIARELGASFRNEEPTEPSDHRIFDQPLSESRESRETTEIEPKRTRLSAAHLRGFDTNEIHAGDLPLEENIQTTNDAPRIKTIEKIHYPLPRRAKKSVGIGNPAPLQFQLLQSSSDNLSNLFEKALQEPDQGNVAQGTTQDSGSFPALANWKNWSPKPPSEISYPSSIAAPRNIEENAINTDGRSSPSPRLNDPPMDLDAFLKRAPRKQKNMF